MPEKKTAEIESDESASFKRRFKYALIAGAIVEFIVMALVVYSKVGR